MARKVGEPRYYYCKRCGGHRKNIGHVSNRGLCNLCADEAVGINVEQMVRHQGENFRRWRENSIRALGGKP